MPGKKSLRAPIHTQVGLLIGGAFCRTTSARGAGEPGHRQRVPPAAGESEKKRATQKLHGASGLPNREKCWISNSVLVFLISP